MCYSIIAYLEYPTYYNNIFKSQYHITSIFYNCNSIPFTVFCSAVDIALRNIQEEKNPLRFSKSLIYFSSNRDQNTVFFQDR